MIPLLSALLVSCVVTLWIVRSSSGHGRFSHDHDLRGPQKFHARPVPRVGGVGIVAGVSAAVVAWSLLERQTAAFAALLLACGMPAFLAGLAEDVTKRVSAGRRLMFTCVAAALAGWLLEARIERTDLPVLDHIVAWPLGALLVTVFVVAGVANSVNIIDGFNGLASMCTALILLAVAYVAFQVGDSLIGILALAGVGAVLGFFVWNFPAGLVFLGDGGAYFLGFYTAELAILLLQRNPAVSPMFPLMVCIYPVFETVFSIYRRSFLKEVPAGVPDGIHLHSLIYRRLVRWAAGDRSAKALTRRNSMTSPYLWMLCLLSLAPAVVWWDSTAILGAGIVLFASTYTVLYWRIVRFRSPRWLRFWR